MESLSSETVDRNQATDDSQPWFPPMESLSSETLDGNQAFGDSGHMYNRVSQIFKKVDFDLHNLSWAVSIPKTTQKKFQDFWGWFKPGPSVLIL